MKPIDILLAGSGILVIANPVLSSTTRSDGDAIKPRIITKAILKTTVRSVASRASEIDSASLRNRDSGLYQYTVSGVDDNTPPHYTDNLRASDDPRNPVGVSLTIPHRHPTGITFLPPHTFEHTARAVEYPPSNSLTKLQRPPTGVPAIPSNRPPNLRRADHRNQTVQQPDYWPIMIHLNGYDVEIPILRDNATDFCELVMKNASGTKRGGSSSSQPTTKKAGSEKGDATKTSTNDGTSSSAAPATMKATHGTDDVVLSTTVSEKGKKSSETQTPTDEAAEESSIEELGSSMATPTGKKPTPARPTITPTPALDTEAANDNEKTEDSISTAATADENIKPTATASAPDTVASDETPTSSKKAKQTAASATPEDVSKDDVTSTSKKHKTTRTTDDTLVSYTLLSATNSPAVSTTTFSGTQNTEKSKRTVRIPSKADRLYPWYRAPFVWKRKAVDLDDGDVESEANDQPSENVEENEIPQEDEEEDETSIDSDSTGSSVSVTSAGSHPPASASSTTPADTDVNIAAEEPAKPTFGIHHSSTAVDSTPTSDVSDKSDEDDSNSSTEESAPTNQDEEKSTGESHTSETAEPIQSDPKPSDSNTPPTNPSATPSPTSASISTPSPIDHSGSAGATLAETSGAAKHSSNAQDFLSLQVFWGILFVSLGIWEMWHQTHGGFRWKWVDEWVEGYGRNVQVDGRTPVQYALGVGRK